MSLEWLWLGVALGVVLLAAALWRLRYPPRRPIQYVDHITSAEKLPSYARERQRGRMLRWAEIGCLTLLIVSLAALASRPQQQIRKVEYEQSRDIVLCMDISGSMKSYIEPAFKTLQTVVAANPTDRYGLVLFGNVPYAALPLTSDTAAIDFVVSDLLEQFTSDSLDAADLLGFDSSVPGGTDVGAGLAGCFRRFDNIEQQRSRHVILVSDMAHNGETDQRAVATLLPKYDVKLYIVAPDFDLKTVQDSPVTQITGAPVETLAIDGSNAQDTLAAIYNTILSNRPSETFVAVDAPHFLWGVAVLATGGWAATTMARWRRQ